MDIYGFLVAGSLITMGNLGDRIGRRRLLLIGAAVFGAASVLAASSESLPQALGLAAAISAALTLAMAAATVALLRSPVRRSTP